MTERNDNTFSIANAEESSGFLLWQVTTLWQQEIKKTLDSRYGVTHSQYVIMASILWHSLHDNELTQVSIAQHTKIEPMNVSQVLKVLETKGYVCKKTHTTDPRAKAVMLTDEGKELVKRAVVTVEDIDKIFFRKLGKDLKRFNRDLLMLIG